MIVDTVLVDSGADRMILFPCTVVTEALLGSGGTRTNFAYIGLLCPGEHHDGKSDDKMC